MSDSSKRKRKRTRPPFSPSTSSTCCSQNGGGPTPLPLNSLDLWNSAGFDESCKPVGYFSNQDFPEPDCSWSETNEQQFMRGVFPELAKKNSVWARSRTAFTQDSFGFFQSPLAVPTEARPDGLGAYYERAAVQKKSLWSAPNISCSQCPENTKGVWLTKNSKYKAASALKCGSGLQLESSDVAKHFEASQVEAVLPATGDAAPVGRETLENLGVENEPCELRRNNARTSKASLVSDSRLDTVKLKKTFWHVPGRSLNKNTRHDKSTVALLKVAKEKSLPKAPSTSAELLERTGEENITWIESLWRQRKSALITASALRCRKAPSPSLKVSKPPVLGKKNEAPLQPPKGGLQHEAKDVIVQTM
ncbi:uncharacterized protein LOC125944984 [Dermacentor silvarum]|uniref:uncharacterized protein LOC125944984 n=1 Tax=Dermacentor silvarum TaxID=543639 RepID=UPI002100E449|nr:uncharacterized protein LOC125944984 [Dermacentor silvarum]